MDDLALDPRNIRLETPVGAPEADIIQDLFANEKALSLVEAIAKVGWLTHEVPIVVTRDDQLVVVEGNRRIAALKAIQNPYLAPAHTAKINSLTAGIARDSLKKIQVKQAPTQDDADQLIAALHTGQQRVAWKPARQQAFFQAQIDAGKSLETLQSQYPTIPVIDFVGQSRILQLFREATYEDPALKAYINTRRFPVSTLARLYDKDEFLGLVGITHDRKTASVRLAADPRIFNSVCERIVGGIKLNEFNTRTLNTTKSPKYVELMDDLRELINTANDALPDDKPVPPAPGPPGGGGGGGSSRGGGAPGGGGTGGGGTPKPPAPPTPSAPRPAPAPAQPRKYLDMDGMVVDSAYPKPIHDIFEELKNLNVERYPNASLDLIRTFLEKTIKAFAERNRLSIVKTNNQNGFVQLGDCLAWLEQYVRDNGPKAFIQVVVKIRVGRMKDYIASQDHLNAINHNHHIFATATDVRDTWGAMKSLMELMLK